MNIILASQSPRRKELLRRLFDTFDIRPAAIDETPKIEEDPVLYVRRMAQEKAAVIAVQEPDALVIASDTTVVIDREILGKAESIEEAEQMLQRLSGQTHHVYTAVTLQRKGKSDTRVAEAAVTFYPLTPKEIADYLNTGEYEDKAGAYGIQGQGGVFVKKIDGDYYAIVGFPIGMVNQQINEFMIEE